MCRMFMEDVPDKFPDISINTTTITLDETSKLK